MLHRLGSEVNIMSKKLTDKQIIAIAEKAFIGKGGCKLPKSIEEAEKGRDDLANFITKELLKHGDNDPEECERLMRYAGEQLIELSQAFFFFSKPTKR
jgi:hypothetical protein